MAKVYTGIRLIFNTGGTKTKLAISKDGEVAGDPAIIDTDQDADVWLKNFEDAAKNLIGGDRVGVVCGGIAGVWDEKKTKLLKSPNLPEWENRPIKKRLEEMFSAPVFLENDVALEGLGEASVGAGRRKQIVAYVSVGTGIGGVKIADGKICPNAFGFEPGHQIVFANDEVGYWEDLAAGAGIYRIYGKHAEEIEDEKIWEEQARILAIGIHNLILIWSPEMLILGGSVMKKIDIQRLTEIIRAQMKRLPKLPEIVRGELTEKAGLYGGLAYLRQM